MSAKIALDAMGGDNAPSEIVKGCIAALPFTEASILLFGDGEAIEKEVASAGGGFDKSRIEVVHTTEVIGAEDSPVRAVRSKKDSSMVRVVEAVRSGDADIAMSAGNTGALMSAALFSLGRLSGVDRPAIVALYPILGDGVSLLVDAGANSECKSETLLGFAKMGSLYMSKAMGIESPTVGLINIGTEEGKGTAVLKETYKLLEASGLNFIGNVEGRDIPDGVADVLVCDGFTGNIVLKLTEGLAMSILRLVKAKFQEGAVSKAGAILLYPKLQELKREFDYSSYGGAPILGVDGLVFKMHGSSGREAVKNAVIKAAEVYESGFFPEIKAAMR